MTDNLEQAGAAVDNIAATAKIDEKEVVAEAEPSVSGIIAHLESFGEIAKEDVENAIAWLKSKL